MRGSPVEQFINIRMGDAQEKSGASVSLTPQVNLINSFLLFDLWDHFFFNNKTLLRITTFLLLDESRVVIINTTLTQVEEVLKRIGTNTKVKSL